MAYLLKMGHTVKTMPDLDDYVADEPDLTAEPHFEVEIRDENRKVIAIEVFGSDYPSKKSIKWCILRHHGESASVKKIFTLS